MFPAVKEHRHLEEVLPCFYHSRNSRQMGSLVCFLAMEAVVFAKTVHALDSKISYCQDTNPWEMTLD